MLDFWFIRHGESETNAGLRSKSDAITPLTNKGRQQAEYVADAIEAPPDLIVLSQYSRTEQTALPTINKFPSVPVETWPIHEFSYLSHEQYAGTDTRARRKLSENYFRVSNPEEVLGPGGESFNQFIGRVETAFQKLVEKRETHEKILLFGHGWFIRASLWLMNLRIGNFDTDPVITEKIVEIMPTVKLPLRIDHWLRRRKKFKMMHSFLFFSGGIKTPNCSIVKFRVNSSGEINLLGYEIDHLPEDLQKTTIRNR